MTNKTLFTLTEPVFDQNTIYGRFRSLLEATDARYCLTSNKEVMRQYAIVNQQIAREQEAFEKTGSRKVLLTADEIKTLRHAANITKAAIHPDT